jgi:hypothetical protein
MRDRIAILRDLIECKGDMNELKRELSFYPWDSNDELVVLNKKMLSKMLRAYLEGSIDKATLVQWAEMIECREDIGFQPEHLLDHIAQIANPDLYGESWERDIVGMYESMITT